MFEHKVNWTHVKVTSSTDPLTELEEHILKQMCFKSAKGVKLQCSREYWDNTDNAAPGATQLHLLENNERKHLLTNNMITEMYLSAFAYLASLSPKRSNKHFKALRIRDDLMF